MARSLFIPCLLLTLVKPIVAQAAYTEFPGIRPLGMGGALRAAATGDAALQLNPSGMNLARAYVVEGSYQYRRPDSGHVIHTSIVDTTSTYGVGGGVYYTYASARPSEGFATAGHEAGVALSFPMGERVFVGSTLKYLSDSLTLPAKDERTAKGLTVDVGLTLRPSQALTFGIVGQNLAEIETARAPRNVGFGIAAAPSTMMMLAVDTVVDFRGRGIGQENVLSYMGGAEFSLANVAGLRGGAGYDGIRENAYGSAGFSLLSDIGAIDACVRQDFSGTTKATFIGISLRAFVPSQ